MKITLEQTAKKRHKQLRKEWLIENRAELVRVLEELYNFFIENPKHDNGLCNALCVLYDSSWSTEHALFHEYAEQYKSTRKRFYDCDGDIVRDSNQYWWKKTNRTKRLKWLDEQIKKLA